MDRQARSTPCPDDESLRAFALGDLSEEDIEAVGRHLASCPWCESRAESLDARTDHVLDELRRSLSTSFWPPGSDSATADPGPPVGPDYVIEGPPIGVGATGLVYKARHVRLNRPVALKMIARRPDLVGPLFEIEARAVARLQHPNIVQIYDIGGDDRPFLALEFVDGGSLEDRMTGGPWPPTLAVATLLPVVEAVDHAHRHGIVHCDLKPSNILTTREGVLKIADFGVAKWTESDGFWKDEWGRRGTPRYMAPEQAGGAGGIGPAADVYSLGIILYEMLVGRLPSHPDAATVDAPRSRLEIVPSPPSRFRPGVPRDLDRLVLRCLHKRPEDRYRNARELADDLRRFLTGAPPRRGRVRALSASVATVLALAWSSSVPPRPPLPPAPPSVVVVKADAASRPKGKSGLEEVASTAKTLFQDDGTIRLGAASAAVSGPSLKFEGSFGNLGFWHSTRDWAAWTFFIEPVAAKRYGLELEYSHHRVVAVDMFEVRLDGRSFRRSVESTNAWSDYRVFPVADVDLSVGFHTIEIRPVEPLRGALFDLRAVVLSPTDR